MNGPNTNTLPTPDAAVNPNMRAVDGTAGWAAAGAMLMDNPGVLPKAVGAVFIAKGVHDAWMADGREYSADSAPGRLRDRFYAYAESLVDQNTGKMNLVARMKKGVGESMLDFKDKEYRNRFSRMVGGMMIGMTGLELSEQPGMAAKIIGLTISGAGIAEQVWNTQKTQDRFNDLRDPVAQSQES